MILSVVRVVCVRTGKTKRTYSSCLKSAFGFLN